MSPSASTTPQPLSEASGSRAWLDALQSTGSTYDEAVKALHAFLLRAARFEVSRRRASLAHVRGEQLDDIAMQAADDALVAVLGKLDEFRGASRFTTWAYKFALLEAGTRLRRRAWQDPSYPLPGRARAPRVVGEDELCKLTLGKVRASSRPSSRASSSGQENNNGQV